MTDWPSILDSIGLDSVFTGPWTEKSGRVLRRRTVVLSLCFVLVLLFLMDLLMGPSTSSIQAFGRFHVFQFSRSSTGFSQIEGERNGTSDAVSSSTRSVKEPISSASDPTGPHVYAITSTVAPSSTVREATGAASYPDGPVIRPTSSQTASDTPDSSAIPSTVAPSSTIRRATSVATYPDGPAIRPSSSQTASDTPDSSTMTTTMVQNSSSYSPQNQEEASENVNDTRTGFVVWSRSCQIPDIDPWHPTVRHLIKAEQPLDCTAGHPPISQTGETHDPATGRIRTWIRVEPSLLSNWTDPYCCYQKVVRKGENNVKYGDLCLPLDSDGSSSLLNGEEEELVRVRCSEGNHTVPFFTDLHPSWPDKKAVRHRISAAPKVSDSPYSLLILGVDTMSRLNAHRQLPQTLDYLRSSLGAIEMKGFQKVGDNTFPNLVPLLTGYSETQVFHHCRGDTEKSLNGCPWIWNRFAEAGYRTLYGEDTPWMSTFNYLKPGFADPPTDYYSRPYVRTLEQEHGWKHHLNYKRCLGPRSQAQALTQWTTGFMHKYSTRPYWGLTWINSFSHDYLNIPPDDDLLMKDFLRDLKEGGHLDRTVLVFMGDHGYRWGEIMETYVGRMENRLPVLFLSLPQVLREEHPDWAENVRYNSHRLSTAFDLHSTFLDLLPNVTSDDDTSWNGTSSGGPGISLFRPLPVDRTCEQAGVDGQWCTCQQSREVPTTDQEVVHVAEFVVDQLNHLLARWPVCETLALDWVSSARLRSPLDHLKGEKSSADIFDYSVTFRTAPGGARLDATVRFVPQNHTHELLGEVTRLNLYGKQSWCVRDTRSKNFCYCKKQLKDNAV